jgi:hypothetical protein
MLRESDADGQLPVAVKVKVPLPELLVAVKTAPFRVVEPEVMDPVPDMDVYVHDCPVLFVVVAPVIFTVPGMVVKQTLISVLAPAVMAGFTVTVTDL